MTSEHRSAGATESVHRSDDARAATLVGLGEALAGRSRAEIEALLDNVELTPLVAALADLTTTPITGLIEVLADKDGVFTTGPTEGASLDPAVAEAYREWATESLHRISQGDAEARTATDARVDDCFHLLTGTVAPADLIDIMRSELEAGTQPHEPVAEQPQPTATLRVAVIGAGVSGILASSRLTAAGIEHTVFEKNEAIGGTWLENRYPGCRLDTSNLAYAYSMHQTFPWKERFSSAGEVYSYLDEVAHTDGVLKATKFGTEVTSAEFDESSCTWNLHVTCGDVTESYQFDAVISAVGQLNRPMIPEFPGQENFEGRRWHSAQWPDNVDLSGLSVAVIGTGASAFQIIPEIAATAGTVHVIQRTPPWVLPTPKYRSGFSANEQFLFESFPILRIWYRMYELWNSVEGRLQWIHVDPTWHHEGSTSRPNELLRQALLEHIQRSLGDHPELMSASIPPYPPGAKRMLRDDGRWYETLKRSNVHLVTDEVVRFEEHSIVFGSGESADVDVVIYATGFRADEFLAPMTVTGRGGIDLHQSWAGDPRAYLGIAIAGFPNLFCLYGPNTALVVNGSSVFFIESSMRYVLSCFDAIEKAGAAALDVRREVVDEFYRRVDEANSTMAWGVDGVNNWYKGHSGRVTQVWPLGMSDYWRATLQVDPSEFEALRPQGTDQENSRD